MIDLPAGDPPIRIPPGGRLRILVGVMVAVALVASDARSPVCAQSADAVLVLVNAASDVSRQVADYYARRRGIPRERLLELRLPPEEHISRAEYAEQIETPVAQWLASRRLQDRILYIVLTKGIPLRVDGTGGRSGTSASVDSELTLLYRKMVGVPVATTGPLENPYYFRGSSIRTARPFSRVDQQIYLVTRLDGYTLEDVTALIDRSVSPERDGKIALDLKAAPPDHGADQWLRQAAEALEQAGFGERVLLEQTGAALQGMTGLLGYYSWGSNDPAIRSRDLKLGFVRGAIAGSYVSTDARTLIEPPASWQIGNWADSRTWFGGSPQSLAGDLIRGGITGIAAQVAEPFVDAAIRPQVLFSAYLLGMNLAEAFYLSMPYLSWQTVIIGDPLCAPFRTPATEPPPTDAGIDPATELPALFAARRAATVTGIGIDPAAGRLLLRAEARLTAGDRAGARDALEKATALAGRLTRAQLLLASLYEAEQDDDRAGARYRAILDNEPNNVLALNNLAFALAERKQKPGDGLPFAERAYAVSPTDPSVLDTLAWIYHLLGDSQKAVPLLEQATRLAPSSAQIHLHAAVAFLAGGREADARRHLARALEISPTLATSDRAAALLHQLR